MAQQQPITTSVSDIIGVTMLPDPTVPVPFEKFAGLKDSDDMLMRAAFWCFYAAWQNDHTREALGTKDAQQSFSVEARHDGHQLRAVTNDLDIRDAVIITRHDLATLREESEDNTYRPSGALIGVYVALSFLLGTVVTLWAAGIHLW